MATTPVLISVEEYLTTTYRPDRDYIDGEVLERNMGEKPHARLQIYFARYLAQFEEALHAEAVSEQRVQITSSRFRIPDVALIRLTAAEPTIVRTAPIFCIEILSSADTMRKLQARLDDYATLGVPTTWVIDPWRRRAFTAGPDAIPHQTTGTLTVPSTPIALPVAEIFAALDKIEARTPR